MIKIEFHTENDSFASDYDSELRKTLNCIATSILSDRQSMQPIDDGNIIDTNGNLIGYWEIENDN